VVTSYVLLLNSAQSTECMLRLELCKCTCVARSSV